MSKPLFGYWKLRGLAQPARFMMAYLGIEYDEKLYSLDEAGGAEWFGEKFSLGLTFPNVPYYKEGDVELTESKAILRYLAREKGNGVLFPKDPKLTREADQVENVLWDLWIGIFGFIPYLFVGTEEQKKRFDGFAPKKFEYLAKFLGANKFLIGNKISFVDFILYEILFGYTKYDGDYFKAFPTLEQFKKNFEAIPAIAEYIKSPKYIASPCFHPGFVAIKV